MRTINQKYQAEFIAGKRKKVFLKILIWLTVALAVLVGLIYFFFFSKVFNVREVSINNSSFVGNKEIREVVDKYLEQKFLFFERFSNIFLVDSDKLQTVISESFPQAKNVSISKKYLHGLLISLERKETAGIWCFKDGRCYYFDREGTAFDSAIDSDGSIYLSIYDETKTIENLGEKVAEKSLIDYIFDTKREVEKLKIAVAEIVIPSGELFRINIKTGENWELYLNTQENLQNQINSLKIFLSQKISQEKRLQLQYIDVRIPNRVYYK